MKKILGLILFTVFSIIVPVRNITLAQGEPQNQPQGNQTSSDIGIKFGNNCLKGMGRDCFDYEKMVGIADQQPEEKFSATSIAQDLIFAATYIIGTVLTIVMIYCGLMYIFAARAGNDTSKYKKGLINAAIGAFFVWGAYAIVRLIQYIAAG